MQITKGLWLRIRTIVSLSLVTVLPATTSPAFADAPVSNVVSNSVATSSHRVHAASLVRLPSDAIAVPQGVQHDAPAPKPKEYSFRHAAEIRRLTFIPNIGQHEDQSLFIADGANFALSLEKNGLSIETRRTIPTTSSEKHTAAAIASPASITPPQTYEAHFAHVEFLNSDKDVKISGEEPSSVTANFFLGADPSKWRSNVASYGRVRYANLYPGIDLIYYGKPGRTFEYDLVVAPGADPGQIRMRVSGEEKPSIDESGNLLLDGPEGAVSLKKPVLYQNLSDEKKLIAGSYRQLDDDVFAFEYSAYDHTRPLVVDPTLNLLYSTYMGGIHDDESTSIALDASNNAYILGYSASQDFPVTGNAVQPVRKNIGLYVRNVVVLKFNASGGLIYSTFLGGTTNDYGQGIVLDSQGRAYITGSTASTDFPVTANAYQTTPGGGFLSVIGADGSTLDYSSYFPAEGNGIALNPQGQIVIAGTAGGGLPVTQGSYKPTLPNGVLGAYAAIFDLSQSGTAQLVASSYYGTDTPQPNSVQFGTTQLGFTLDAAGNVWIGGEAYTPNLPTTPNAMQTSVPALSSTCVGNTALNSAAYFVELSPDLKQLKYATYFSGMTSGVNACSEWTAVLTFDAQGNLFAGGGTASNKFPATSSAFQNSYPGGLFVSWVAKFTPSQFTATSSAPVWCSYLGGNTSDTFFGGFGRNLVPDSAGNVWAFGQSEGGSNFPITPDAFQQSHQGDYDGFLTKVSADGTKVLYSTWLGGGNTNVMALALDPANNLYLTGDTTSTNFPLTAGAFQTQFANGNPFNDGNDIFFSILGTGTIGGVSPPVGDNSGDTTITVSGAGFEAGATCSLAMNGTTITASMAAVSPSGTSIQCTFELNGAATGSYSVVVANPNGGSTLTEPGAFTVASGGRPQIWTNVVGRPKIRTGTPATFTIDVGNSGTVNAYEVHLVVTVPGTVMAAPMQSGSLMFDGGGDPNPGQDASVQLGDGNNYIPLQIPVIAAGATVTIPLQLTTTQDLTDMPVGVLTDAPWYDSLADAQAELAMAAQNPTALPATCASNPAKPYLNDCLGPWVNGLVADVVNNVQNTPVDTTALARSVIQSLVNGLNQTIAPSSTAASQRVQPRIEPETGLFLAIVVIVIVAVVAAFIFGYLPSLQKNPPPQFQFMPMTPVAPKSQLPYCSTAPLSRHLRGVMPLTRVTQSLRPLGADTGDNGAGDDSGDGSGDSGSCDDSSSGGSVDPNYKAGPSGDGSASQYVRAVAPLTYSVGFENEPTAALPAAAVVVTDQLDPTKVDLTTVSLGAIAIGSSIVTLPAGTTNYATTYTPPGVTNYVVRIQGSLNPTTGLLKWTFQTIDPSTSLPPSDPTVGFLPPDTDGIKGQGSVVFHVMPKAGQATGAPITNGATVVFDTNAPINTPTWLNTLDVTPPVSQVTALPANEVATGGAATFNVNWSGTDVGSGIFSYSIYVSDNGGPFTLWQNQVMATSATYTGTLGHTYGFFSRATDAAGNMEAVRNQADASTMVVATSLAPSVNSAGVVPACSSVNTIQPGSWVSIYGSNLAAGSYYWNGDFPQSLGGTSVTINGKSAYIWFAGPNQVNVQAPDDTTAGTVQVVVSTPGGTAGTTVRLASVSPCFDAYDGVHVAGIIPRSDGSGAYGGGAYDILGPTGSSLGIPTVAAKAGDVVELFGGGFGPTSPPVPAGMAFSGAAPTTNPVAVMIAGVSVPPAFTGLSEAGVYQINIVVPAGLGSGDVPLQATVGGVQTPTGIVISLQ